MPLPLSVGAVPFALDDSDDEPFAGPGSLDEEFWPEPHWGTEECRDSVGGTSGGTDSEAIAGTDASVGAEAEGIVELLVPLLGISGAALEFDDSTESEIVVAAFCSLVVELALFILPTPPGG